MVNIEESGSCRGFSFCICIIQIDSYHRPKLKEIIALGLLMAFLGGSAGALVARQVFRHKTRKQPFASLLIGIAMLQIAAVAVWLLNRTH